jgi:UDP-N-acetylmuramyl tripeptide synthase
MGLSRTVKCRTAESAGKLSKHLIKLGSGMGKSYPGYLFLKLGSLNCVNYLAKKLEIGTIIITGTNGKTTTTKMTILLLAKDAELTYNYESNTINAIVTGLLTSKVDLGVFEYGIRDIEHAIPDTVCKIVDPVGVVYTNISREHSQVSGRKNPFKEYLKAKQLLSTPMKRGVVICNADDPRTTYIGKNKEQDTKVTYYGLDIDLEDKTPLTGDVFCPICEGNLVYSKRYLNHRGIYKCTDCGFNRPEPDIKISKLTLENDIWRVNLNGEIYNYPTDMNLSINLKVPLPAFGIHNLYNLLCAVTTYISFTPTTDNINKTINETCKSLDLSILPPGRFEIFKIKDKWIGMGQGDNGDALKANIQFMESYLGVEINGNTTFIYTTPDEGEDEIFEDHYSSLNSFKPIMVHVIPGRESIEAAKNYYEIIKETLPADFYPIPYEEMDKRIDKIRELVKESSSKYIIVSGCGPEDYMWGNLKSRCKSQKKRS